MDYLGRGRFGSSGLAQKGPDENYFIRSFCARGDFIHGSRGFSLISGLINNQEEKDDLFQYQVG